LSQTWADISVRSVSKFMKTPKPPMKALLSGSQPKPGMVLKLSMRLKPSPAARLETPKEANESEAIAVPDGDAALVEVERGAVGRGGGRTPRDGVPGERAAGEDSECSSSDQRSHSVSLHVTRHPGPAR
jgi:hypothetical protein